jgi:carbonic anhydrase/acetyltransferase-like protein (isoleucine patch superfamily)
MDHSRKRSSCAAISSVPAIVHASQHLSFQVESIPSSEIPGRQGEKQEMIYNLGERKVEFHGEDWFVADNATVIGSVILKNNASIWFNVVVRGDNDLITIGENTNIQDGSILHTDAGIQMTLGWNVTIGHMAMLHGCTVGDNTLVGIKSVILNNAVVGNNCLIGANTLIPEGKVIPDGSVVMGAPGRVVRSLSEAEIDRLRRSASHYVENFKRYQRELTVKI